MAVSVFAQNARLQLIHNSGDIDAANLEVLVNGAPVDTLAFQKATPFTDYAPGFYDFNFVATIGADKDTSTTVSVTLDAGVSYVGLISGITNTNVGEGKYANPDPGNRDISMTLLTIPNALETATDPAKVEFSIVHGSTDALLLDILMNENTTPLVDDINYGQSTAYMAVDPGVHTFDVTPGDDNATLIGRFEADMSGYAGMSAVVFTSGFQNPANNESASKLGLFAAKADGEVVTFEDITPGEAGPWTDAGLSEYEFDDFVGADTLVSGGHGIVVDKFNRIWIGNFNTGGHLRVVSPDGVEAAFSPIDSITVGATTITTRQCRGLGVDKDGNILFARSAGDFFKINVETGEGLAYWKGGGSLLKPAVDQDGNIYVGLVVGINPITVLDPNLFTEIQTINLDGAPSFGRGLEVTADGKTIFTPDLGASGGPVYKWTSTDLITYTKTDSIKNNTEGKPIFLTQRTTMDWGPDSTLWVSSDNAYAAGNNDPNGFVVLDFAKMEYKFAPSPEIAAGVGNGPRGVAFSATGDTAYATYFNGNRLARFVKKAVSVTERHTPTPDGYVLEQNYPNPFNPSTNISFKIAKTGKVDLKIYNVLGQEVAAIYDQKVLTAGRHLVTFDASNIASGVYYYKLSVDGKVLTKRMTFMK